MRKFALFILVLSICVAFVSARQESQSVPALNPANMDLTIRPCVDFYGYANGTWLKNNPIPPEYSRWGSFQELADKNTLVLKEILEQAAANTRSRKGSNEQKIGDFWFTGMDSARVETLGAKPISSESQPSTASLGFRTSSPGSTRTALEASSDFSRIRIRRTVRRLWRN